MVGFGIVFCIMGKGTSIMWATDVFLKQLYLEDLEEVFWILSLDQKEHFKTIFRYLDFQADATVRDGDFPIPRRLKLIEFLSLKSVGVQFPSKSSYSNWEEELTS